MARTAMQDTGDAAERAVADRLRADGWTILGRNLRVGRAEIDILGVDPGPPACLVIVEVRERRRRDFGLPEETVDYRKRARLWAAGCALLDARRTRVGVPVPALPLRLDLVAIDSTADGDRRFRHHRWLGRR
jgi:putative endonuclease